MLRRLAILTLPWLLSACSTLGYLQQAGSGQAEVMQKARPIEEVLADPTTSADLAMRLRFAQQVRRFAITTLKLPDNASYTQYSDLGRPYALWNIVTTPALSLKPLEHCFPLAGCLQYRGYYTEAAAQSYATAQQTQGMDVFLYGVPAYSTLGWFNDPLLNTTIRYERAALARLIFHELSHQVAYSRDDSAFNEAYATAVELEGYEAWLKQYGDEAAQQRYQQGETRKAAFHQLMDTARRQLAELYGSNQDDETKRAGKAAILQQLQHDYQQLKVSWNGYSGYDFWFTPAPNNAHFASLSTYHQLVPQFRALFQLKGGDWRTFHLEVQKLSALPRAQRRQNLLLAIEEWSKSTTIASSPPAGNAP